MVLKKINKKGAEGVSLTGTIAGLALLLIVVVILVFFFAKGSGSWGDFFGNLFGGTAPNIESVVTGCKAACGAASYNDYCTLKRDVIFVAKGAKEKWNCAELERRIPGVGLDICDKVSCTGEVVKCKDLGISNCRGLDPSKCTIDWIAGTTVAEYQKNNIGAGKTYLSIDDLTGMVTDLAESNQQKANGMVCVKLVKP